MIFQMRKLPRQRLAYSKAVVLHELDEAVLQGAVKYWEVLHDIFELLRQPVNLAVYLAVVQPRRYDVTQAGLDKTS